MAAEALPISEVVTRRCSNCRFSEIYKDGDGRIDFKRRVCKWGPPVAVLLQTNVGVNVQSVWPIMDNGAFCWRFEARMDS